MTSPTGEQAGITSGAASLSVAQDGRPKAIPKEGPCNPWYTNFVNGDISAQIILEALDAEAGFVSVIYENSALVRQIKQ